MQLSKTIIIFAILLSACSSDDRPVYEGPLFRQVPSSESGIEFENKVIETKSLNINHYQYLYNGSGTAILDINNDGLQDLFFGGNNTKNKLYLNKGNLQFEDISQSAGITNDRWTTGVSVVDINEDGFMDIYLSHSGPYSDPSMIRNELFVNNGNSTFTERAKEYGIDDDSFSSHSTFFDYDNDGDLDLFVVNHSHLGGRTIEEVEINRQKGGETYARRSSNTLYENINGRYVDRTKEAGLFRIGFGLSVAIRDFNEDGFLDIFVANDFYIPDYLFLNNGNKTFTEGIKQKMKHTSFYSMGCDAADINNDGLTDLAVLDMTSSDHVRSKTLMESMNVERFNYLVDYNKFIPQYMFNSFNLNKGQGNFSEISNALGVALTDWSWSVLIADFDNSGWKDVYITNGFKRDTKDQDWNKSLMEKYDLEPEGDREQIYFDHLDESKSVPLSNYLFKNNGSLDFSDESKNWGLDEKGFSQGASYGDLDNDGDLDLIVNNLDSEAFLFENKSESSKNNFIQFKLSKGPKKLGVVNAVVTIYHGDNIQTVDYVTERGYQSAVQEIAHFGLGQVNKVDKVEIKWPDGTLSTINSPKVNKLHMVDKNDQQLFREAKKSDELPTFVDLTYQYEHMDFVHQENPYNDFEKEILLPHKQSTLGPALAVGDINKDGMDDIFVGGALGQSSEMLIQSYAGITKLKQDDLAADQKYEDLGAVFFDANGDGYPDLYVSSGGGGEIKDITLLQDRLYINNGRGKLQKSVNALPRITSSTKIIKPYDIDNDGDLDLFVGGRTSPGQYPKSPESYILQNDNGIFKNITSQISPELSNIGMVTDASWVNIDDDPAYELIVVGEWMPVTILKFDGEKYNNITKSLGLENTHGWWYSLSTSDLDNDGDVDLVVGNIGKNNKFHPSPEKPFHLYSNDFDDTGTLDIVLSKTYNGELVPVRGKECSSQQMPFIKDKFPKYQDFATASLYDIYGSEKLESSLHLRAETFEHLVMLNEGGKSFSQRPLPNEAQICPILSQVLYDFNKDGNVDLVIGGNVFDTEVETPSYDAGKGLYLIGNGDGTFAPQSDIRVTGINISNNVKELKFLRVGKDKWPSFVVANNNGGLSLLAYSK